MRIFVMTQIGNAFASNISKSPSDGLRVLYFLRRNKWKASDEQLQQFVISDKYTLQKVIQDLKEKDAIREIGRNDG